LGGSCFTWFSLSVGLELLLFSPDLDPDFRLPNRKAVLKNNDENRK